MGSGLRDGQYNRIGKEKSPSDADRVVRPTRLLSVEEVADWLQVPVATIYQWRYRGEGPLAIRVGRYLRFDPSDVSLWLKNRKAMSLVK